MIENYDGEDRSHVGDDNKVTWTPEDLHRY